WSVDGKPWRSRCWTGSNGTRSAPRRCEFIRTLCYMSRPGRMNPALLLLAPLGALMLPDELDKLVRPQRLADPESLEGVAAARAEKIELLARGHALGNHAQAQAPRQRDDRLRDRGVARVGFDIGDGRTVDRERVDPEVPSVAKPPQRGPVVGD